MPLDLRHDGRIGRSADRGHAVQPGNSRSGDKQRRRRWKTRCCSPCREARAWSPTLARVDGSTRSTWRYLPSARRLPSGDTARLVRYSRDVGRGRDLRRRELRDTAARRRPGPWRRHRSRRAAPQFPRRVGRSLSSGGIAGSTSPAERANQQARIRRDPAQSTAPRLPPFCKSANDSSDKLAFAVVRVVAAGAILREDRCDVLGEVRRRGVRCSAQADRATARRSRTDLAVLLAE